MNTGKKLVPLTVRLLPATYRGLTRMAASRPHLSINAIVNEILDSHLTQGGAAPQVRTHG